MFNTNVDGISGAAVDVILPTVGNIKQVLNTGNDIYDKNYMHNDKLYDFKVCTVLKYKLVCILITEAVGGEKPKNPAESKRRVVSRMDEDEPSFNASSFDLQAKSPLSQVATDFMANPSDFSEGQFQYV
jgi:hypothetical protein